MGQIQTTLDSGFDDDDIYSNMDHSPIEIIHRVKRWRLLIALSIPVIWLIGTIAYFTFTDKKNVARDRNAG